LCSFLLLAGLFPADLSYAAFDLRVLPPAERSCSAPAALGLIEGSASAMFHSSLPDCSGGLLSVHAYRPFGLAGVDVFAFRGRATSSGRRYGMSFAYSGLVAPGYGEQTLSISIALSRDRLWLEPGLTFGEVRAPGLYEGRCMMFDFAAYAYAAPRLRISFEIGNAFASRLDAVGGAVPRRVGAGLGYAMSGSVACGFKVEKENGLRTAIATGLEWRAMRGFFVRLGSSTYPREFSLGLGLRLRGLGLNISSTANFDLGTTHEAGVTYVWK
jgi:hypothetical protein